MIGFFHIFADRWHHALRMPLHTEQRSRGVDKRFHRTIRSMGNSGQIVGNTVDDLVVIAVDSCSRAELFGKPACTLDRMAAAGVTSYMLLQGTAEKDVDGLHTAADTQYRLATGEECVK